LKKVVVALLLALSLLADTLSLEAQIYASILRGIFPHKHDIIVWSDNPRLLPILRRIEFVVLTPHLQDAQILIVSQERSMHKIDEDEHKVIFVTRYALLKKYADLAIGGFFWQKGRPNIYFLRKNIQKHHIHLSPELEEYVEDRL